MAGPFSPRETTALYLGVNDYGDNFDAIKEDDRYKDDLAGRSVRSLRRKVRYDHQKAMRRQQLFLELLNEHINVYGVDHVQNLVRGALEVAHIQPPNLHDVMNRIDKELLKLETKIPTLLKDFISDFKDAMPSLESEDVEEGDKAEEHQEVFGNLDDFSVLLVNRFEVLGLKVSSKLDAWKPVFGKMFGF